MVAIYLVYSKSENAKKVDSFVPNAIFFNLRLYIAQALYETTQRWTKSLPICLYRDVWIAAIASSRTRLATLTGVMCKTSQCGLRSFMRKFGNVERNSHCDVLHITPIRVARLFLDCNGDFAIKAYEDNNCVARRTAIVACMFAL